MPRLTLRQLFLLSAAAIALLVGVLLFVFLEGSRRSVLETSQALRTAAARRVEEQVQRELGEAQRALENVERKIRTCAGDQLREFGDDLRVQPASLPPAVAQALASPLLGEMSSDDPERSGELAVERTRYLVTFRALTGTQDWLVGIVVPEDYYTRDLVRLQNHLDSKEVRRTTCSASKCKKVCGLKGKSGRPVREMRSRSDAVTRARSTPPTPPQRPVASTSTLRSARSRGCPSAGAPPGCAAGPTADSPA